MPSMRRVVITGMGIRIAMAKGVEEFFSALVEGRSGVTEIAGMPIARNKRVAAQIKDVPLEQPFRARGFASEAIAQALGQSGLSTKTQPIGLYLATVFGDSHDIERRYQALISTDDAADEALRAAVLAYPSHTLADALARAFDLRGLRDVNTNACASGNIAIVRAMEAIRNGRLDAAVVCGVEQFRPLAYWGADRAGILGTALRPFDVRRDGTVLGEGAGALVLEERSHAEARGAAILAELSGHGLSCSDNPHEIIPPLDGGGVSRCIIAALDDAGVNAEDVDYINAHATGTVNIEVAECRGIRLAFGERAQLIPINATKSYTGHLSSASAIVEVIATVLALTRGFIHPNHDLDQPDETLGVNLVGGQGLHVSPRCAVSIAMGAGGVNSALVVRPSSAPSPGRSSAVPDMDADIWFSGAGAVSVAGVGLEDYHEGLIAVARSGLSSTSALCGVQNTGFVSQELLHRVIPNGERYDMYNRAGRLGLAAVLLAVQRAGLRRELLTSQRMGLIVGTNLGGNSTWTDLLCEAYERSPRTITPSLALPHGAHLCATLASRELGLTGWTMTLTSGAVAGFSGIALAVDLLRARRLDAVVVCGVEILDRMLSRGYKRLGFADAPDERGPASDVLLGEGAAAVVLERADSVLQRGGRGLARAVRVTEACGLAGPCRFDDAAISHTIMGSVGDTSSPLALFSSSGGLVSRGAAERAACSRIARDGDTMEGLLTSVPSLLGEAGAASPMLSLVAAIASVVRGYVPPAAASRMQAIEGLRLVKQEPEALREGARLVVLAANPGGAAACVSCEAL